MSTTTAPATPPNGPSSVDLSRALRRRWWLVALVALLGAAIGVGASVALPPKYSATVTLVVQLPKGSADTEALVRTVEALTTSSVVVADIATNSSTGLSPSGIQNRLKIDRPSGSAVISVAVIDTDRNRARAIASQVVPSLQQRITESRSSAEAATSKIAVESFGGGPEVQKVTPPVVRNALIGAFAGFALGLLLAVIEAGRVARGAPPMSRRVPVWPRRLPRRSARRPRAAAPARPAPAQPAPPQAARESTDQHRVSDPDPAGWGPVRPGEDSRSR